VVERNIIESEGVSKKQEKEVPCQLKGEKMEQQRKRITKVPFSKEVFSERDNAEVEEKGWPWYYSVRRVCEETKGVSIRLAQVRPI